MQQRGERRSPPLLRGPRRHNSNCHLPHIAAAFLLSLASAACPAAHYLIQSPPRERKASSFPCLHTGGTTMISSLAAASSSASSFCRLLALRSNARVFSAAKDLLHTSAMAPVKVFVEDISKCTYNRQIISSFSHAGRRLCPFGGPVRKRPRHQGQPGRAHQERKVHHLRRPRCLHPGMLKDPPAR